MRRHRTGTAPRAAVLSRGVGRTPTEKIADRSLGLGLELVLGLGLWFVVRVSCQGQARAFGIQDSS